MKYNILFAFGGDYFLGRYEYHYLFFILPEGTSISEEDFEDKIQGYIKGVGIENINVGVFPLTEKQKPKFIYSATPIDGGGYTCRIKDTNFSRLMSRASKCAGAWGEVGKISVSAEKPRKIPYGASKEEALKIIQRRIAIEAWCIIEKKGSLRRPRFDFGKVS